MATEQDLWRLLKDVEIAISDESYAIEKEHFDYLPSLTQRTHELLVGLVKACEDTHIFPSSNLELEARLKVVTAQQHRNRQLLNAKQYEVTRNIKKLSAAKYQVDSFNNSYLDGLNFSLDSVDDRPSFFA